jgi:hypothetical protein
MAHPVGSEDVVGELGVAIQEHVAAWSLLLATIVLAVPGAGLGALVSALITEWAKKGHQRDLEGVKLENQRQIEALKGDLARDLSRETETLRSQLNRLSFEHQTRFSRLHLHRFEVVDELYKLLVRAERSMGAAMTMYRSGPTYEAIDEARSQEMGKAANDGNAFFTFAAENDLWLEVGLADRVDQVARYLRDLWLQYHSSDEERGKHRQMGDARRQVSQDVPNLRKELRQLMRAMLEGGGAGRVTYRPVLSAWCL